MQLWTALACARQSTMFVPTSGRLLLTIVAAFLCCWIEIVSTGTQKTKSVVRVRGTANTNRSYNSPVPFATAAPRGPTSIFKNATMTAQPLTPAARQTRPFKILHPRLPDVQIECVALRSKRYISDGFCTSIKPVSDVVCTGNCLPIHDLPWYAEFIKVWSRQKTLQYRCVDDLVRVRKVTFMCKNGETRSYDIRVVRSCKCKRYLRNQNDSSSGKSEKKKTNNKR